MLYSNRIGRAHYVLESTGGYERMAAWLMMDVGLVVSIVNPSRVRHYALIAPAVKCCDRRQS